MNHVLVVGGGNIGREYSKILVDLNCKVTLLSIQERQPIENVNTIAKLSFDLSDSELTLFDGIIVAVPCEKTFNTLYDLLERTKCPILVEKPIALNNEELEKINSVFGEKVWGRIYVAFNRRFFSSIQYVKDLLKGQEIVGCNFCFSEMEERVSGEDCVKQKWMLANSIHVFDVATSIAGYPENIKVAKKGTCTWHPVGSSFIGFGEIDHGFMNFEAYWGSAGNWEVSFITKDAKYILNPMESVLLQKRGSIQREPIPLSNCEKEKSFKTGFYRQTQAFLSGERSLFISGKDYVRLHDFINNVAGY